MQKKCERQKLIILGASTFAEEVADLVSEIEEYRLVGFVEGIDPEKCHQTLSGLPVIWIDDVGQLDNSHRAVCAVGATKRDKFIQQALSLGLRFTTIVHPTARISPTASLGRGTIVSAGVVIAAHTKIGQHIIFNRGSLIGHHVEIGDYVTISPGANIGGICRIGEATYIGMGAVVIDHTTIGAHAVVAAGAVVTKDVPDNVLAVGAPARIMKKNISEK